ncbi:MULTISPECIES: DUF4198 domain-containing protein [unclassified Colwellia]|uniref:DUF4198 domain-containing protein n=1 Tax=unclassified Colwellia TaxID=196834 RepID=UPI0015F67624|nr:MULTISPECIES: DUF4198 domain-containing protein [unclassified Colwellia]MBA6231190.1 DUF4198 domain-containing protein [Colwellia sp. MB02u-7]MBA6235041.1 DUF4198 domain-containing protein [Colwellia sp. MB02u-11]MBA6257575.1 DUF4198 domain-containing protein [Colwellia sp. MB3u-28]MBA6260647.1 DUF4198 domain-containing protein [Colwellia sp. MB3u-41]MBA6301750.1 DUF4198 domain-containing protein [Colwellia sp. MB3u-22]
MNLKKIIALTIACAISTQTFAHSRWVLPTHFNLSAEQGEWIMVDITASNETFNVDKAMGADLVRIITPDGKSSRPSSTYKGHRKSVADYFLAESGTYKITNNSHPSYMTSYTMNGDRKRLSANKAELSGQLPNEAKEIKTTYRYSRIESYVTMNTPSDNFKTDGQLLELIPVTHPSDIAENEKVTFKFLFNGKAQKDVSVEITADGARYRNNPQTLTLVSNEKGEINFMPKAAGRYLLIAEHQENTPKSPLADQQMGSVFLTFEAQLN